MNDAFTSVKNLFRPENRPVSHACALVFLGTSIYVAHAGLQQILPGALGNALTALFIALAVLQWLAMGRQEACLAGRDHDRAEAVIHQAWMFGVIETVLYAAGGLSLAGMARWEALPIALALAAAALFAYANFRVKWVSCDGVGRRAAPAPLPAKPQPRPSGENIYDFVKPARDIAGYGAERRDVARIFREELDPAAEAKAARNRRYYQEVTKPRRQAARRQATA